MIEIKLDPEGTSVTMKPVSFLGRDKFPLYRDACYQNGAKFIPAERINRAPLSQVADLLQSFKDAGLDCQVDPSIVDALRSEADAAVELSESGTAALEAARADLEARGLSLFKYQETGVQWLAPRKGALLTDEMGLGKTVQALVALPRKARAIVVVPNAVKYNWMQEIKRWRPDLRATQVASKRTFRWPVEGEVIVVTWSSLPGELVDGVDADGKQVRTVDLDLPMAPGGVTLIADEAHCAKNAKAQRTMKFEELAEFVRASEGSVWLLTGTPLLNRPPELWQLLSIAGVAHEAFSGWQDFVRLFRGAKSRYGYDWGSPDAEVPDRLRRVILRRNRSEVLRELPPKMRTDTMVNGLSAEVVRLCDEVLEAMEERGVDLSSVEALELKDVPFEMMAKVRSALAAAKTPAAIQLVEEYEAQGVPVVVFSAHRTPVDALGKREGWATITGDTSTDERGRIVEDFQAGKLKGLAGTIGAMGVGVTLTHAHHLILVDLAWTPALNSQAEDRCCRIGQEADTVHVTRLIASHELDQRVVELLTYKQMIIEGSVEAANVDESYLPSSPDANLLRAASLAEEMASRGAAVAEQKKSEREVEVMAEIKSRHDGREMKWSDRRRSACCALEDHARQALAQLVAADQDYAREQNGIGFSQYDCEFGHSLHQQLEKFEMLTERQWRAACKLAVKYRRQVGEPPVA